MRDDTARAWFANRGWQETKKNAHNFEHVYVLQELEMPCAARIQELEQLADYFEQHAGTSGASNLEPAPPQGPGPPRPPGPRAAEAARLCIHQAPAAPSRLCSR